MLGLVEKLRLLIVDETKFAGIGKSAWRNRRLFVTDDGNGQREQIGG